MSKRKNKFQGSKASLTKKQLTNMVMGFFNNHPKTSFNYKQIAKDIRVSSSVEKQLIINILSDLAKDNYLEELYTGKYKLTTKIGHITGTVDMTAGGYAFIVSDQVTEDIFVSMKNLNHALQGDTVKVFIYAKKKGTQPEGEVTEIVKRARTNFVGTIEISKNFAFLISDSKKMPYDIFIPKEKLNKAKNGQKAIAQITDWPEKAKNPFGEIVEVLGNAGENETEMHAILAEFGLPYHFPEHVDKEAENISDKISKAEIKKRRDFRGVTTITIDPYDAKDFDDAISISKLPSGNWEIGVHIADVSHYVPLNSIIDQEAYNRGTSVYLVDRVVPMLPEKLSNFVCSLRPNEEKLCFSAVFEMDNEAQVINSWFGRTVIKSDRRFTYEEAQEIIETGKGDLVDEIITLHTLAKKLRAARFKNGSISLERMEVKFDIAQDGTPLGVKIKEQKEANQLIEEFMLLANKKVAELFAPPKGKPVPKEETGFVYRIHDNPNTDKLQKLNTFIRKFGYHLNLASNKGVAASVNKLMSDIRGKNEQNLFETLILRAMAKAKYSTINIGHYGLAFKHYTHFTSPIRRYPDLMVHRLLAMYLEGQKESNPKRLEKACTHASDMEKLAVDAERASIKYKQVEYMSKFVGKIFDGVISGVTSQGIFIEVVENKCEGMVLIRDMMDDFYEYDEDHYTLTGRRTRKKYQLGDAVKIKIKSTNLAKRQMDMILI